ncbi:MAG: hypothetical protein AAFQ84_03800 [Pseudomonadota bacterium]
MAISACASSPVSGPAPPPDSDEPLARPAPDVSDAPLPATDIWETTPEGLRHRASGFICASTVSDFAFTVEEVYPGLPAGQDVSCAYGAIDGGAITFHLTAFARPVSVDAHLKAVTTRVSDLFRRTAPASVPLSPNGEPITETSAALRTDSASARRPGTPVDTAVWIETIGAWHVKARATYEIDRAEMTAAAVYELFEQARDHLAPPVVY